MLGGVTKGPILPHFELLKEAGFEGVELISPNELDRDEVLKARDKTGLVIHGVSGSRHWEDPLSDPDPTVVERGLAAIRQEIDDCKAYGGTTVLVVPAVVTKKVSYRDAYDAVAGEHPQAHPRRREGTGSRSPSRRSGTSSSSAPSSSPATSTSSRAPASAPTSTSATSSSTAIPQEWIRELGKRILKIHIKEYAKPKRFDYPLGEGEIDWPAVRQALRRRRLRRLDHRRGRLRRPGGDEGRRRADGQAPRARR